MFPNNYEFTFISQEENNKSFLSIHKLENDLFIAKFLSVIGDFQILLDCNESSLLFALLAPLDEEKVLESDFFQIRISDPLFQKLRLLESQLDPKRAQNIMQLFLLLNASKLNS